MKHLFRDEKNYNKINLKVQKQGNYREKCFREKVSMKQEKNRINKSKCLVFKRLSM